MEEKNRGDVLIFGEPFRDGAEAVVGIRNPYLETARFRLFHEHVAASPNALLDRILPPGGSYVFEWVIILPPACVRLDEFPYGKIFHPGHGLRVEVEFPFREKRAA